VAIARAWHKRIGVKLGKKSIEHSVASGRWSNLFPLAVVDEPAEAGLHAPVR
jgi:hypothetical protein